VALVVRQLAIPRAQDFLLVVAVECLGQEQTLFLVFLAAQVVLAVAAVAAVTLAARLALSKPRAAQAVLVQQSSDSIIKERKCITL